MKVINNFNDYMFNMIVEKMKLKVSKFELILSKKLRETLLQMNNQIADDLMSLHRDPSLEKKFDRTFLDLGDEPGDISFIMSNKVPDLIEPEIVHGRFLKNKDLGITPEYMEDGEDIDELPSLGDYEYEEMEKNPWISDYNHVVDLHDVQFTDKTHPVWTKNRVNQKASRVINSLLPNKYPSNVKRGERPEKPNDVESFQDQFTAIVEANSKKIVEVKGNDISHFYDCNQYFKDSGTLGGSCMKDPSRASRYLKLYTENTDKISLLVLFPEGVNDKIIGRAILWKLDKVNNKNVEDTYFMDRIYVSNSSDEFLFQEYAKKKGYYYKSVQAYGTGYDIVTPDGSKPLKMSVKVESHDGNGYEYYPYVDTLQYYCKQTGECTNHTKSGYNYVTLTSTGGGYN